MRSLRATWLLNICFCFCFGSLLIGASSPATEGSEEPQGCAPKEGSWRWIHSDGVGLREKARTLSGKSVLGWKERDAQQPKGGVAASTDGRYAVLCDWDGNTRMYRVQLYPNLYQKWGYMLYGETQEHSTTPAEPRLGPTSCEISDDATTILQLQHTAHTFRSRAIIQDSATTELKEDDCQRIPAGNLKLDILYRRDLYPDTWSGQIWQEGEHAAVGMTRDGTWMVQLNAKGTVLMRKVACTNLLQEFDIGMQVPAVVVSSPDSTRLIILPSHGEGTIGGVSALGLNDSHWNHRTLQVTTGAAAAALSCTAQAAVVNMSALKRSQILFALSCKGSLHMYLLTHDMQLHLQHTFHDSKSMIDQFAVSASGQLLVTISSAGQRDTVEFWSWNNDRAEYLRSGSLPAPGRVTGLSISELRRYNVLCAMLREDNSVWLWTASSDQELPLRSLARARQDEVNIFHTCIFPLDRTCSMRDASYISEWVGLQGTNIGGPVLLLLCVFAFSTIAPWDTCDEVLLQIVSAENWVNLGISSRALLASGCCIITALSVHEICFQPAFINDWPAHLHHVEQWREGRLDYSDYMHFHGNNPYGAMFLYFYDAIYFVTGGHLKLFQVAWATLEVLCLWSIGETTLQLGLHPIVALLPVLSNRMHLYAVRVVTNDAVNVVFMLSAVRLLGQGKWLSASILYSLVLGLKLNFVFYGPGWVWAVHRYSGYGCTGIVLSGLIIGGVQLLIALPFLLGNAKEYILTAFDLSRNLLWDKTRVLKFVGRVLFQHRPAHVGLLALSACSLLCFFRHLERTRRRIPKGSGHREILKAVLGSNQIIVCFAKALYTPFLCWHFYSLPMLMALFSISPSQLLALWAWQEVAFRPSAPLETENFVQVLLACSNLYILRKLLLPTGDARPDS